MIDVDGVIIIGRHQDGANWATDLERDFGLDKTALRDHFFRPFWADIVTGKDDLLPRLQQALSNMQSDVKASDLRDYWFANDAARNAPMLDWIDRKRTAGHRT